MQMSFPLLDTLAVLAIIVVAAWYVFKKLIVRKDSGCSGCSGGCAARDGADPEKECPSAPGCRSEIKRSL
jgi:hypothetical protein